MHLLEVPGIVLELDSTSFEKLKAGEYRPKTNFGGIADVSTDGRNCCERTHGICIWETARFLDAGISGKPTPAANEGCRLAEGADDITGWPAEQHMSTIPAQCHCPFLILD